MMQMVLLEGEGGGGGGKPSQQNAAQMQHKNWDMESLDDFPKNP